MDPTNNAWKRVKVNAPLSLRVDTVRKDKWTTRSLKHSPSIVGNGSGGGPSESKLVNTCALLYLVHYWSCLPVLGITSCDGGGDGGDHS